MDFVGSYIPTTPTKYTPRAPGRTCDYGEDDENRQEGEYTKMMQEGNFDEVRQCRKDVAKKTGKVQFIAPLSEDGASLQSIYLTPKDAKKPVSRVVATPDSETRKEVKKRKSGDKVSLFGFKFRSPPLLSRDSKQKRGSPHSTPD